MKQTASVLIAALLAACLLSACGNAAPASAGGQPPASGASEALMGAYSEDRDLTDEDLAIFDAVAGELTDASYQPLKVSTQVVAGLNYRFYTKVTGSASGPEESYAYVYIYVPLGEEAVPELTEIKPA